MFKGFGKGLILLSEKMPIKLVCDGNVMIFFLKPPNKVKFDEF